MRILFLQKHILFPTNDGGKVRTLNVVRHLARWHDVTYLCNLQPEEEQYLPAMQELGLRLVTIPWRESPRWSAGFYRDLGLNIFSRYPFNVCKDYDRPLRAKAAQLLKEESFDVLVCDFVQMARNAIGLESPPKILFQHNVEAEIFARHAQNDSGRLRRWYMGLQCRKMRRFESFAGKQFDAIIAVSERDKKMFEREYGWKHAHTIDTAVDIEHYRSNGEAEIPNRVVFVGSLDWLPNIDGLRFFVRDIWPRIREQQAAATFQIVGRNPSSEIMQLHAKAGIEVLPNVPDTRPYLQKASVVVVPLLVGGGTRLKIFEAMAMETAVVSTELGAEGLKLTPGRHIELADDPSDFASTVLQLLSNQPRRSELAENARTYVERHFAAEIVARQFEAICRKTAQVNSAEASV